MMDSAGQGGGAGPTEGAGPAEGVGPASEALLDEEAWLVEWAGPCEGAGLQGLSPPTTTQRQWAGPGGGAELSDSSWSRPLSHSTFRPVQIRKQGAGLREGSEVRGRGQGLRTRPQSPAPSPMGPTALPHRAPQPQGSAP